MYETIILLFVGIGFFVASMALAINFCVGAYLDYQEQQVTIEHGIRIVTKRNSKSQEADNDDDFTD